MATFRLLHISDLHFSARPNAVNPLTSLGGVRPADLGLWRHFPRHIILFGPSSYSSPLATHLALYIDSIQDAVDAIIVTGDLATTGSEVDLSTAKAFFFADTRIPPVARVKLNLRIPVIFLPGNHDRF